MSDRILQEFASKDQALVIAPAGCGKTELIVKAAAHHKSGRSLILTHTHAGVRSLIERFKKFGISSQRYTIDTIAGFALTYANAFPQISDLGEFSLQETPWRHVYEAGTRVIQSAVGKRILQLSYKSLYVDEYQDCTLEQHRLIINMSKILPCRIVGDPLQGVFDFENVVSWDDDIFPHFETLPELQTAWRWETKNKPLGDWLRTVRHCLLTGESIDTRNSPAAWKLMNQANQVGSCFTSLNNTGDSIVAIHKWSNQAHSIAQKLKGNFTSMEEVECKDLFSWALKIEESSGPARAVAIIDFACDCMTKVSTELATIKRKFGGGNLTFIKRVKHLEIALALIDVSGSGNFIPILTVMDLIRSINGSYLYRRELWQSMRAAIKEYETGQHDSLSDAAWTVRDRGRILGRLVERRTVSRTLLVKGLEFDHSIILDANQLSTKELYVAMTRGTKSLTILSSSPILEKEVPNFG